MAVRCTKSYVCSLSEIDLFNQSYLPIRRQLPFTRFHCEIVALGLWNIIVLHLTHKTTNLYDQCFFVLTGSTFYWLHFVLVLRKDMLSENFQNALKCHDSDQTPVLLYHPNISYAMGECLNHHCHQRAPWITYNRLGPPHHSC